MVYSIEDIMHKIIFETQLLSGEKTVYSWQCLEVLISIRMLRDL